MKEHLPGKAISNVKTLVFHEISFQPNEFGYVWIARWLPVVSSSAFTGLACKSDGGGSEPIPSAA